MTGRRQSFAVASWVLAGAMVVAGESPDQCSATAPEAGLGLVCIAQRSRRDGPPVRRFSNATLADLQGARISFAAHWKEVVMPQINLEEVPAPFKRADPAAPVGGRQAEQKGDPAGDKVKKKEEKKPAKRQMQFRVRRPAGKEMSRTRGSPEETKPPREVGFPYIRR